MRGTARDGQRNVTQSVRHDELKEKLGTDTLTGCDVDKVGMDAADQIERDQKEIEELKAKVEQYRALIPSWVIPMTPKEDTP